MSSDIALDLQTNNIFDYVREIRFYVRTGTIRSKISNYVLSYEVSHSTNIQIYFATVDRMTLLRIGTVRRHYSELRKRGKNLLLSANVSPDHVLL